MGWKDELKKGQKFMRDAYMFANTGKLPDKKPNPNAGKLDLGHLRAEAERNGFNPLTVLRATGGQGSRYSNEPARLSSGDFWKVFNQKTQTETQEPVLQKEQNERGRHDIPLTVTAYDPNGVVPDFDVVNPELIESSANEALSSAAMIATQYVAQHGGDYETVLATIQNINQSRINNNKDPIRIKNDKIADEVINQIKKVVKQKSNSFGGFLDGNLQSFEKIIGYDRNEKILVTPILQQQRVMEELFP